MTKLELRKAYKTKRANLSIETIDEKSLDISNQLLTLNIWDKSFYHVFLSMTQHKEINTDYILNILAGKDKHIVVSKSNFVILLSPLRPYNLGTKTCCKENA